MKNEIKDKKKKIREICKNGANEKISRNWNMSNK